MSVLILARNDGRILAVGEWFGPKAPNPPTDGDPVVVEVTDRPVEDGDPVDDVKIRLEYELDPKTRRLRRRTT